MIHVLYENPDWLPPLKEALEAEKLPVTYHFVEGGSVDLGGEPPAGVWINRMSPSSHTRGHQGGVRHTQNLLLWLEAHGRPVINGSAAFAIELSKVRQDLALQAVGVRTPRTVGAVGKEALREAARQMSLPFITKHDQGGKGLGVQLFRDLKAFDAYLDGPDFVEDPGGVTLLQQYIEPADGAITRIELADGELVYAMRSSTAGGFELCPADACAIDEGAFCPTEPSDTFRWDPEFSADDPLVGKYLELMRRHGIALAGIEFVTDAQGHRYTYDINGTTNYNGKVEAEAGVVGMSYLARMAKRLLG